LRRIDAELRAVGADPSAPSSDIPPLTFRGERAGGTASALSGRWKSADPELRSFVAAEPTTVEQMVVTSRRLRSTIVTYWVGTTETFIGVVRPDGHVRTATVPVSGQRLNALARATQPDVKAARGADTSDTSFSMNQLRVRGEEVVALASGGKSARRELYRLLIAPIADLLPRDDGALLTIVPHGPLFLVSFAALVDERDRYLLERFTIHYAPSTAVLQYTARRKQRSALPRYLLVSDPADMPALEGDKPLPRLPGSREEVAAVARSLQGREVTVLTGASAHEDQVRQAMAGKTVLHFATHGIVRDDEPFDSFLAFGHGGASSSGDGRLTAQEIYGLDLHADLVILSACRTAAGRVTGDGIIGLTRAFLYAGTPTVMATLWDIADEPGLFLLPHFYDALGAGGDASHALRSAQLKFLARLRAGRVKVNSPFGQVTLPEDPLFWAGFIVIGEP
jgi:CHAT domain-containing protein